MKKLIRKIIARILYPFYIFNLRVFGPIGRELRVLNFKRSLGHCGKDTILYGRNNSFQNLKMISIGNDFSAGDGFWLATYPNYAGNKYSPKIIIGNHVSCSKYCHIGAINHIEIGDNTLIGSNVLIIDHAHGESYATDIPRAIQPLISRGGV